MHKGIQHIHTYTYEDLKADAYLCSVVQILYTYTQTSFWKAWIKIYTHTPSSNIRRLRATRESEKSSQSCTRRKWRSKRFPGEWKTSRFLFGPKSPSTPSSNNAKLRQQDYSNFPLTPSLLLHLSARMAARLIWIWPPPSKSTVNVWEYASILLGAQQ